MDLSERTFYVQCQLTIGGNRGKGFGGFVVYDVWAPAPALADERSEEQEVIG